MTPILTLVAAASTLFTHGATPALRGLDPVSLCEGTEVVGLAEHEATHGRYLYRFADEQSRARFLAEPERWCIQWGGACARMGPLSGTGDPERWTVHAGRLFVFASDGCRAGFLKAPERFVPPAAETPSFTAEARAAGEVWIERAVDAHGGARAVDGSDALRLALGEESSGWKHRLEHLVARDGRSLRRSVWTSPEAGAVPSETTWVVGADAFCDENGTVFDVTSPDQIADLRRLALREPLALLWARKSDGFLAAYVGPGELEGEPVEDVRVRCAGLATTLHLDPESGRIVGLAWRGRLADGPTREVVERFDGWREVEGVVLPVSRTVRVDGEASAAHAIRWGTVELLSEVPPDSLVSGRQR